MKKYLQSYYSQNLSAEKLRLCYEIAPRRVKQYLEAEIAFVLEKIGPSDLVLELGCGYGRVLQNMISKTKTVVGIDTSYASLLLAQRTFAKNPFCYLIVMDAVELGFCDKKFDTAVCIQNGISAFKVNRRKMIEETIRVTRSGGIVLFSSYSEHFWEDRLEWFRLQSKYGLIGEIDEDETGNGIIICKDGFRADTVSFDDFITLTSGLETNINITEVDKSSIFCEILVK
jgi:ubiquinone/menaquinone biosynthesis C-methylase UbiE